MLCGVHGFCGVYDIEIKVIPTKQKHLQGWNHLHEQISSSIALHVCSCGHTAVKHFITNNSSIKQIRGNHMTQLTKGSSVLDELLVKFISNRTTHTHGEDNSCVIIKISSRYFQTFSLHMCCMSPMCMWSVVWCVCERVCV